MSAGLNTHHFRLNWLEKGTVVGSLVVDMVAGRKQCSDAGVQLPILSLSLYLYTL